LTQAPLNEEGRLLPNDNSHCKVAATLPAWRLMTLTSKGRAVVRWLLRKEAQLYFGLTPAT